VFAGHTNEAGSVDFFDGFCPPQREGAVYGKAEGGTQMWGIEESFHHAGIHSLAAGKFRSRDTNVD